MSWGGDVHSICYVRIGSDQSGTDKLNQVILRTVPSVSWVPLRFWPTNPYNKGGFHYGQVVLVIHMCIGQLDLLTKFQPCACTVISSLNNEFVCLPCIRNMSKSTNHIIYLVVEFDKEPGANGSSMDVVPDNWQEVDGNDCVLYPYHYGHSRVIKAARRGKVPSDEWRSFPIVKVWYKTSKCKRYACVVMLNPSCVMS